MIKLKEPTHLNEPAQFWINKMLLPVTPNSFKINNNNTCSSEQTVDGAPMSVVTLDKPQKMSVEFMIPMYMDSYIDTAYTFKDSVITNFKYFTDELWKIKYSREPAIITCTFPDGVSINGKWVIFDYDYNFDKFDINFSLTLEEYYPIENQEVNVTLQNTLIRLGLRDPRKVS